MIISDWFQGRYSDGSYDNSNLYISSSMIRINNVVTSVTRAFNTFPIVLKRWGRIDASSDWYENGEVESRQSTATIYFFDRDRNMVGGGLNIDAGETMTIANKELAIYVLVTVAVGADVVNRNIHPKDADPPEDYPSNTYYQIDTDLEYTFTEETWSIGEDGFPHSNFAELFPKDMTIPIPKAMWRITEGYNNGFPFNELLPNIPYINFYPELRENVIRVYDKDEPQSGFVSNGLAILHPSSCVSIHNDDRWDITLTHPVDEWGKWRNLLVVNVLKVDGQLFRIKKQKPYIDSNGMYIEVEAKHITTDLADESCFDFEFSGGTPAQFVTEARSHLYPSTGYSPPYQFNISAPGNTVLPADKFAPASFLALLVGLDNSLLNRIGGELYRDNFDLTISKRMAYARDDAFNIRYSLDMTEITQEVDYSDFCTLLYCYDNWGNMWSASYAGTVHWAVHHQIVKIAKFNYAEGDGSLERLMADGQNLADRYLVPKVTYKLKIAALKNDPKYKDFLELQNYRYGDSGTIYCPELDISTKQRIVEIEKNELTGEIIGMTLGNMVSSVVRPTYMGSTVTSGYSASDKANAAMQAELNDIKIRQLKTWLGIRSYTWAEVRNNKWEEYR